MMMMNLFTFAREIGLAKHFSNFMCIIASLTRCAWAFPFSERSERSELPCQWFIHQLLWLWAPEAEGGLHSFIFLAIWTSNCHSREVSKSVINKNFSSLENFSDCRSTERNFLLETQGVEEEKEEIPVRDLLRSKSLNHVSREQSSWRLEGA
jgi:hypothetical protein